MLIQSETYEGKEMYFEFLPKGRFTTNTDIDLNKLILDKKAAIAGNFNYQKTQHDDLLILPFTISNIKMKLESILKFKPLIMIDQF